MANKKEKTPVEATEATVEATEATVEATEATVEATEATVETTGVTVGTAEGTAAEKKNPWKEKKTIFIPKLPGKSQPPLVGSVNGRSFSLPRNKSHEVPLPIYEVVARSIANEEKADDYYYGIQAELTARSEEEAENMK